MAITKPLRVLVLEDRAADVEMTLRELRRGGFDPQWHVAYAEAEYVALLNAPLDLIVSDYTLPQFDALRALDLLQRRGLDIPFIVVTGTVSDETAVECMRRGAADYLLKDRLARLGQAVEQALARQKARDDKRTAENALGAEHAFRVAIEDCMLAGVAVVDLEGRQTYVNPAICRMVGWSQQELVGDVPPFKYWPPEEADAIMRQFRRAMDGEMVPGAEAVFRRSNGERFDALMLASPLVDGAGRRIGTLATIYDISRQKLLEQHYYQAQKMESVGRLAGGVAHDFNNLLTAIMGFTEMSLSALPGDSPVRPYLEEVKGAGERAATLTRQLLAFSRRQTIQPKVIDVGELVSNMAKMLRRLIGEDIELDICTPEGIWSVKADPGQIEQVLVNLAVNAREAMPKGGKLTIEIANASLGQDYAQHHVSFTAGDYVAVSVTDTGPGMSPEVKEHLFEPFFTTKRQGTGLGLATCYGIVEQSGGHISVYSELGLGTTVRFYLPRTSEGADQPREAQPAALPEGKETVLLAEDEEAVRWLCAACLRQLGYTVLEASDGSEALRLLQDQAQPRVHLLVTDLVMPKMRGKELSARVKALRPETRVLFMSGYAAEGVAHGGELELGGMFLQKPFTPSDLARKVRKALDQ